MRMFWNVHFFFVDELIFIRIFFFLAWKEQKGRGQSKVATEVKAVS